MNPAVVTAVVYMHSMKIEKTKIEKSKQRKRITSQPKTRALVAQNNIKKKKRTGWLQYLLGGCVGRSDPLGGCCGICLEDFLAEGIHDHDELHRLKCSHVYHKNCILEWLQKHNTCPLCRRPL
ncbi:hypothetical protein FEM48_Zijuj03G0004400 [Ziziphus jujuba var. spinosa]|uniref:RING-type domain-containing protein n=1 Tax=Ziziphus jujuba var. spinosa TaxID=714518 RepID=A0A978VM49_ZIZJJ|nr:hypothetical protein FEM48_Zijuj03G0004400 [Ziziphus jujuba var. spinosa]